jgi:hypothetical protein
MICRQQPCRPAAAMPTGVKTINSLMRMAAVLLPLLDFRANPAVIG